MEHTPKFKLVLVTKSCNGKMKVTVKVESDNEVFLREERKRMSTHAKKRGHCPDYRIVGPIQYKKLLALGKAKNGAVRAPVAESALAREARLAVKALAFVYYP